jgi:hypothetical protein
MAIQVLFQCGHQAEVKSDRSPRCPACGDTAIDRVLAPAPHFVGLAYGPCATFRAFDARPVDLRKGKVVSAKRHPGGPLPAFTSDAQTSAKESA